MQKTLRLKIIHIGSDFSVSDVDNEAWDKANGVSVSNYWSGETAPIDRWFEAGMLWSDDHLYARFEARQDEPLVISDAPMFEAKTLGLWDRDVVEIFVAPDRDEPRRYFEFEVAPTGEWIDIALDATSGERVADWDYASGFGRATEIDEGGVTTVMKIPWTAFGRKPSPGEVWLGNLLRCIGKDPNRGYLAWSPTLTETPNFHVPERFGEFAFVK